MFLDNIYNEVGLIYNPETPDYLILRNYEDILQLISKYLTIR